MSSFGGADDIHSRELAQWSGHTSLEGFRLRWFNCWLLLLSLSIAPIHSDGYRCRHQVKTSVSNAVRSFFSISSSFSISSCLISTRARPKLFKRNKSSSRQQEMSFLSIFFLSFFLAFAFVQSVSARPERKQNKKEGKKKEQEAALAAVLTAHASFTINFRVEEERQKG